MHDLVVNVGGLYEYAYDVYVGRGKCPRTGTLGEWGNPFKVGAEYQRGEAVQEYARWLHRQPEMVARVRDRLRGKVLGCWCAPRLCHGDVLALTANATGIRVLVTGGRTYEEVIDINFVLKRVRERYGIAVIIHGNAKGADFECGDWARAHEILDVPVPADWSLGKKAGVLRNTEMLQRYFPDLLVAFPGGRGTADMTRKAVDAGVPVLRWTEEKGLTWVKAWMKDAMRERMAA